MSEKKETTVVDVGVDISGLRIVSIRLCDVNRRFEWDEVCRALFAYDDLLMACKAAVRFIVNGVEFGYIDLPDRYSGDPALDTLPMLKAAIAKTKIEATP